ncbi:MAG: DUF5652 family protein [Candidatus Falkowbacteria bacterium]
MMTNFNSMMPAWSNPFWPITSLLMLWSLFWAALALWHSARRGQHLWFVAFLFIHTLGILEIIYLFGILKLKSKDLFHK